MLGAGGGCVCFSYRTGREGLIRAECILDGINGCHATARDFNRLGWRLSVGSEWLGGVEAVEEPKIRVPSTGEIGE